MKRIIAIVVLSLPLLGCGNSVCYDVRTVDMKGRPVTNAVLHIKTLKRLFFGAGLHQDDFRDIYARSDTNGNIRVKFNCVSGDCTRWLSAQGYYCVPPKDVCYRLKKDHVFYAELAEHQKEETVVMHEIRNPIPMFSYVVTMGILLPQGNGDYGFDMMMGDLVQPHGKGEVADFYVRKNFDAKSRSTKSELFFTGKGNGAYKCKAYMDSELRSCYEADTNATFLTRFRYEYGTPELLKNPDPNYGPTICDVKEDEYLVLRTRCRYDEKGRLVSCHYAKIYGRIEVFAWLKFRSYAFNPTPNDPNLEFDVKKNLLKKDTAPYFP